MSAPLTHRAPTSKRRSIWLAALALLSCASLLGNYLLGRHLVAEYRKRSQQQLDPFGLQFPGFPPARAAASGRADAPVVLFYGDSRAQQWTAPALPGCRVENRGIGGQTSAQVLGRFSAHAAPLAARVVVLQVGINDLKSLGVMPSSRDALVRGVVRNVRALVHQFRAQGAKVVLTTLFPLGSSPLWRWPLWSEEIVTANTQANVAIRNLASGDAGVVVLDAFALLTNEEGRLRAELAFDTLHLSVAGYEVLNAKLSELLAADCAL